MAFTVDDFQDLLRLLEAHPEWRAALRRHVLSDELLELPTLLRQLAEAQARTEARLEAVAEQLAVLTARVDALAEAQARTEARLEALTARVDALAEAQARTEARLEALTARVDALAEVQVQMAAQLGHLTDRVGDLTGKMLETQYRQRAGAYFSPLARRLHVLDYGRLADRLDQAIDAGQLTEQDRSAILAADVVLMGVRRQDQAEVYIIVEVSAGIGPRDVERAAERARLLAKLGRPVVPVVAGERIDPQSESLARALGVWQVLDGRAVSPSQPASA